MAGNIQRKIQSIDNALYHHGLVKFLIESHMERKGDKWEDSLIRNHFKEVGQEEPSNKTRKSRRKLPSNPKENSPVQETQQDQYYDDETLLASVLETLKQKNVRRKIANNKGECTSKGETEQENVKKCPRTTEKSPSIIIRSVKLNKPIHAQSQQSLEFINL